MQASTDSLFHIDTLTPSHFRFRPTPTKRRRLSVEFQTSTELYALLKTSFSSSKPHQKSELRPQFIGHFSIVADSTITNPERARLVVKDLRDVAGLSFACVLFSFFFYRELFLLTQLHNTEKLPGPVKVGKRQR
ncbi:hypothetical protein K443DRAFT_377850 [Laccaria amethystina LaAM-08-1]|uniref:Uncharacterized protein n=1 Tax=Laccaria amethystina LaAM-08-1 TaxID=1095629 RepID=A0A0C9WIZ4_9AGAR|nr:hypothetical protein K443DRAFT_377850 [Laccaria amethystina LaAM-08-1]